MATTKPIKRELEDYVTNLEEAKSVEKHKLLMAIIKWGFLFLVTAVATILFIAIRESKRQNKYPTLSEISSALAPIAEVLKVAITGGS
jgi:hypothetical protein